MFVEPPGSGRRRCTWWQQTGRALIDDSLPEIPELGEVLTDLDFEPLVEGIQRRHKVTVKGWSRPNKPKGGRRAPDRAERPA